MLQWLRLAIWLLLSAAVSGRDVQCDEVSDGNYCWNSQTQRYVHCWGCIIKNQQISDNEFNSIAAEHANGTAVDVKFVTFIGGDVTKLPKVIKDSSSKHYFKVQLVGTKTRLINAQFFELAAQHLTTFGSEQIDNLSVAADAFRNCAALEYLNLGESGISSIPRDAFLGLHKLIRLDLHDNKLTDINENLLVELVNLEVLHLQHNQLADIPDAAFDQLQKLKWLYLQENKIEIVRRRWFQNNQQLLTINLEYNQIKVIQSGSFARIFKLSWLSLEGNKCTNRDFDSENSKEISEALTGCLPKTCLIPVILNGHIVNAEDNATQIVGDSSEEYNPVKVVCNQHYSLFHEGANQTENQCQNEVWIDEKWAECHRK